MIRRPPRSTQSRSSAASDVYKRQAKSRWYWGMRLLLISDRRGAPLGYDLRPANENEREGVFQLACAHPGSLLFADAGHRGREYHESLQLVGVELIVPARPR